MKNMKKWALLLVVSMLTFGVITGCGDSSEEGSNNDKSTVEATKEEKADISGTWKLTGIEDADGNLFTLEEYCALQGVDSQGIEATYEFNEDKTVTAAIGGIGVEGTYEFDGTTVTVTFAGQDAKFDYDSEYDVIYSIDEKTEMISYMERK